MYKIGTKEQIEAINLFQKQLEELLAFAPSKRIKIQYEVVKTTWKYYKELIKAEKDIESASKILDISNDILNACHKGVIMLEEYSGTEKSNLINISGRQRMLSQRIALYYIANKWGVKNLNIKRRFETSKKEFWIGLKTLISSDKNDSNIEFNLDLVKKKFRFAKKGYELDGDLSAQDIFRFTNDIQIKMNIITNMYENNIK